LGLVEYVFENLAKVFPSLWEIVQDLMDLLLLPSPDTAFTTMDYNQETANWQEAWCCVADCAVEVMLLLHGAYSRFSDSVTITVEDRTLMVQYSVELMDILVSGPVVYQPQFTSDPRVLSFVLVQWVTQTLSGKRSGGDSEGVVDLLAWLDFLLDGLSESSLREVSCAQ
jgi:hypothetical protein